jgi:site-specific DNA recombinase
LGAALGGRWIRRHRGDRHGLELATVTGEIDLATPTGRLIARMLGAAARHEAEHKAERQQRQRRQNAEAGKVSGGGARPYGYGEDRVTVIEPEAEIIKEMARRILSGESLASLARDLKVRDVRTPKDGHWTHQTLRRMLASARISGRREHTPRKSYETTRPLLGEVISTAVWPAIISVEDSDRLRNLLSDAERSRRHNPHVRGRTYLLSGILRCGRCGYSMCGRPRSGVPRYVCPNVPGTDSCGGVATNAAHTGMPGVSRTRNVSSHAALLVTLPARHLLSNSFGDVERPRDLSFECRRHGL